MAKIFKKLTGNLYSSLKRFPVSIVLAAAAAVIAIVLVHNGSEFPDDFADMLSRAALILTLGFPVTLCIRLFLERSAKHSLAKSIIAYSIAVILLSVYSKFFFSEFSFVTTTRYVAISIAFYVLFAFIPYFYKRDGLELYIIRLITGFFTTLLFAVVLFLGLAAILFTIDKLLGVNVEPELYADMWLIVAGVFAPCYFLSGIPAIDEKLELIDYPKLFKILLLYIIAPLLTAYTVILYIYFAKILITFVWPQGMVAHLVLWYSLISLAVLFLIKPLFDKNNWSRFFASWHPKIILPLMIMMFVSLGIRINAYGITENRYYVLVLGLWIFANMIYMGFFRNRKGILTLISLSLVMILSVFGPWSCYSVSKISQNNRFESILNKYSMIKDNAIVKSDTEVGNYDKKAISSILRYFDDNHDLSDLKYLPEGFKFNDMKSVFGFEHVYEYTYQNGSQYSSYRIEENLPIQITGYDYLTVIGYAKSKPETAPNVIYDSVNREIVIMNNNNEIYRRALYEFGKKLYDKYGAANTDGIIPDELTFTDENGSVKVKVILSGIYGRKDNSTDELELNFDNMYVLYSLK